MKLPQIIDAEDVGIIAQGAIYSVLMALFIVGFAATLGLAWLVFKVAGGL